MAELEGRGIVQGADLAGHRLGNCLAGMAGAAGPQAGQGIENLAPLVIDQVAAFGRHDQAWVALEVAVGGVGHPVGVQLELAGQTDRSVFRQIHRTSPRKAIGQRQVLLRLNWHGRKVWKILLFRSLVCLSLNIYRLASC
ncbi:hypothetical protein D3C85_1296210 [compost metagenome]